MVTYFVNPYEDEVSLSLIARYHDHILSRSVADTTRALFGNKMVNLSLDLQSHLNSFSKNTYHLFPYDPNEIIEKFTLWPFYAAFSLYMRKNR